jgi:RimJ/RimL family protein N-acetyltransferase
MFCHDGILFRPVEEQDLEAIRALRNDPSTWGQLTAIGHISAEAQAEWFSRLDGDPSREYFSVFTEARNEYYPVSFEGDFVGIIRMDEVDRLNRSVRIGADVAPVLRGKGYGTRIYKALLKYVFDYLGMHRAWLLVLDTNEIGKKLYFNAGFRLEGKHREAIFRNGQFVDYLAMSILEGEYRAMQK